MNVPEPEEYDWKETELGFELQPDSETSCKKNKGFCSSLCDCLNCENTDAARPCATGVLEQQPEALDSEDKVLTSESEEDTDSEERKRSLIIDHSTNFKNE